MENITFFLPCRSGSERVLNKNTRRFAGVDGGLLYVKLKQILGLDLDLKLVVSTNDQIVIDVTKSFGDPRIIIDRRPEKLCLSSTSVKDLIMYVPTIVQTDHVFWFHVTTPFVDASVYEEAVACYFSKIEEGYDSIMSVSKLQSFLWDSEQREIINYDRSILKYPRTQDLRPLFEINHAFYAMSVKNYLRFEDRIGVNPYLFELDKIQSIDIDDLQDFKLAEIIFEQTQL